MGEHEGLKRGKPTVIQWRLFFYLKAHLEMAATYLYKYLLKFGQMHHTNAGATLSKTEALNYLPPRRLYSDADISRLVGLDNARNPVGFIGLTTEFKYLGSIVHHSLNSDAGDDRRVKSALAACGVLQTL
jgi:hypothetical protein